ncbi:lytic transglycosylase domain-containing protein [Roseateles sp. SL47]|uniref:lytic transglycosylase domain-containing protein n=1 Tax=Roseateles sp. SL47 TaxID=2995138 RepID=UPI00227138C1|nr:lytic transglycosylase domain-containing protein [Roseateles sp. SL47]WAC71611.1 lytic transglycosylase domain-containing protein [Roseateles sp. SL47]
MAANPTLAGTAPATNTTTNTTMAGAPVMVIEAAGLAGRSMGQRSRLADTAAGGGESGPRPFSDLVHAASRRYSLDAQLLHAIIRVESNGNPRARSKAGALGLMQVMPGTGARYGVKNPSELMQPEVNIDVGARYLSDLSRMFGDRLDLVVAAYNAGEGAVMRYGMAIPPYAETQDYVQRVMGRLDGGAR